MDAIEVEWVEDIKRPFQLRSYQLTAVTKVREGWATFTRQLLDMATGVGKTTIFCAIATEEWATNNVRTLVLENRDALVRQTAKRIANETGLDVSIEMAGEHASPFSQIVVASVPTLCRDARLTGFADNHFGLVVLDEAHHSCARSYKKVCNYFHYGAGSLAENWEAPLDGSYQPKCRLLGVTATPDIGDKRSLGEIYQQVAFSYGLFKAVDDGWLVEPIAEQEPLKADFRGLRATRTPNGSDYNPTQVAERMIPIIDALARQIVRFASNRKTMAFMPSVNTASMLAEAIQANGLRAIFVSGECLDRGAKTDDFVAHGPGIALCTAAMYTEGFDVPDVDCVFPGITKSRSYFKQKVGRATRPLPGIVDGLPTAELRRAAIANSAKKNFLIIDPFFKLDDINICDFYDLFTDRPEIKEKMKAAGPASVEAAAEAERDFIKALEKEARKHARKAARTIDPLAWAVSIGAPALANYVPETTWDSLPATNGQLDFLKKQGLETEMITCKGLASKIIGRLLARIKLGLARPAQLSLMRQLGLDEQTCSTLTISEASQAIDQVLKAKHEKREAREICLA